MKSGFKISVAKPFLGASPDGIIMSDCCGLGVLEIKCPYKHRDTLIDIAATQDKAFCLDNTLTLKKNHQYYSQLQLQMHVMQHMEILQFEQQEISWSPELSKMMYSRPVLSRSWRSSGQRLYCQNSCVEGVPLSGFARQNSQELAEIADGMITLQETLSANAVNFRPQQQPPTNTTGSIPYGIRPYSTGQRPTICRSHLYYGKHAKYCKPWCQFPKSKEHQPRTFVQTRHEIDLINMGEYSIRYEGKMYRYKVTYLTLNENDENDVVTKWMSVKNITSCTRAEEKQHQNRRFQTKRQRSKYLIPLTHDNRIEELFLSVQLDPAGDGNCQFAALSDQLGNVGIFSSSATLREEIVNDLIDRPLNQAGVHLRNFVDNNDFDQYVYRMKRTGTYGDHITLQRTTDIFNVQIVVYSSLGTAGYAHFNTRMNVVNAKEKRREYKRKWITAKRAAVKKSKDSEVVGISQSSSSEEECNQSEDVFKDSKVSTVSDMDASSNIGDVCMDQFTEHEFDDQDDWTWDMIDSPMIQSSTDESAEDSDTNKNVKTTLAKWMAKHNITQNASDDLLKLLRESGHPNLPKTVRSLLRTPRDTQTEDKSGMEYKYLEQMTNNTEISELKLSLNIDGLPIFKSTKDSLWPILCQVMNVQPPVIFPIALTYGKSKPADLTFLDDTIADLQNIIQNGLLVDEKTYKVSLECIVCDAPAKAMVKNIKLYCGYYGCDKCSQKGVYIGKITYQQVDNLELRTDSTFRQKENPEYYHGETPFSDLPIDMANAFPIDYMHQVCLGVVKRCILAWIRGKKEVRISAQQVSKISNRLLNLQRFIPKLFARQPRSLIYRNPIGVFRKG
ncbi:OTU domain-containing protein [Nymphon striatum]|nr:OTU domain-containing protein [Nymphon striatum]